MRKFILLFCAVLLALGLTMSILPTVTLAVDTVCDGYTYGSFNSSPACIKDDSLHLCEYNFPDAIFCTYITNQFDKDNSSFLTNDEVASVTLILCNSKEISNLKGIEFFTNLEFLYCYDNQLSSLNISKNTKLIELRCEQNRLTSLDVSNNPQLWRLFCESNQLSSLDVTHNTVLSELRVGALSGTGGNNLTKLDTSHNAALTELICSYNQLIELDVSTNKKLQTLICNDNQLTELDIRNNTDLSLLRCQNNKIEKLDLCNNLALTQLICNNNCLATLELSHNTALTYFEGLSQTLQVNQNVDFSTNENLIDMGKIVGIENIGNITSVNANNIVSYDSVSGKVTFSSTPIKFNYGYDCPCSTNLNSNHMDVTVILSHDHIWASANCYSAKRCYHCGITEGAPQHIWQTATCTTPKTCSVCHKTEGDSIAHTQSEWIIDVEPTTTEAGQMHIECTVCRAVLEQKFISKLIPGKCENITNPKENAHTGKLDNTDEELADKILSDNEKKLIEDGNNICISLQVKDISQTISNKEKDIMQKHLGKHHIGLYLDISLFKQIGDGEKQKVVQTNTAVTVTITVPEKLRNCGTQTERIYKIIRIHEGNATILDTDYDPVTGSLTFQTDSFSTYALAYSDTSLEVVTIPQTGEHFTWPLCMMLMAISACAIIVLITAKHGKRRID